MNFETGSFSALNISKMISLKLRSPIDSITDQQWSEFVRILDRHEIKNISDSGGYGSYDIRPRRLVELGYMSNPRVTRSATGRQIYVGDWNPPWSDGKFLSSPISQYKVLIESMLDYRSKIADGKISTPRDVSLSGALSILHIGGEGALRSWPNLFDNTRAIYEMAKDVF